VKPSFLESFSLLNTTEWSILNYYMFYFGMNFNQSTGHLRVIIDVMQAKKCNSKERIKGKKININ